METFIITTTDGHSYRYEAETQTAALRTHMKAVPGMGVIGVITENESRMANEFTDLQDD